MTQQPTSDARLREILTEKPAKVRGGMVDGCRLHERRDFAAEILALRAENDKLLEALKVAGRVLENALFVIRKQGVMPNSSWEGGFIGDQRRIKAALTAKETEI